MARHTGNFDDNGDSHAFLPQRDTQGSVPLAVCLHGDFGGGTVKPYLSPDGGTTWVPVDDGQGADIEYTDARAYGLTIPVAMAMKLTLAGSTSPDLDWWVVPNRDT